MKSLILLAIALTTAAQAQQPTPCLKLSQIKQDHRSLHQGDTENVRLKFEARNCYVLTESPTLGRQMPVLEVQSEPGINTQVGAVGALRLDQSTVSASILKAKELSTIASVAASSDATPGEHKLAGTIRYKVMDSQGNVSDEVLAFDIPIKVEPAAPNSARVPFPERHPVLSKALLPLEIIAFIALLPLVIVAGLAGWDGC